MPTTYISDIPRYKAEICNAFGGITWKVWDFDTNMVADDNGPVIFKTRYQAEKWILAHPDEF